MIDGSWRSRKSAIARLRGVVCTHGLLGHCRLECSDETVSEDSRQQLFEFLDFCKVSCPCLVRLQEGAQSSWASAVYSPYRVMCWSLRVRVFVHCSLAHSLPSLNAGEGSFGSRLRLPFPCSCDIVSWYVTMSVCGHQGRTLKSVCGHERAKMSIL